MAHEPLPFGENGGANGAGGFAGNRLHGTRNAVKEAGRKPFRSAPVGKAPSPSCVSDRHLMAETTGSGRDQRVGRGPKGNAGFLYPVEFCSLKKRQAAFGLPVASVFHVFSYRLSAPPDLSIDVVISVSVNGFGARRWSAFSISISIAGNAPHSPATDSCLLNAAHRGRRKQQEESMFKMTKDDLAKKTDAQLAALFQQASVGLAAAKLDVASAQSHLAMIRAEIASRVPSPR